jgi:hypothetical protein
MIIAAIKSKKADSLENKYGGRHICSDTTDLIMPLSSENDIVFEEVNGIRLFIHPSRMDNLFLLDLRKDAIIYVIVNNKKYKKLYNLLAFLARLCFFDNHEIDMKKEILKIFDKEIEKGHYEIMKI